MGLFSNSSIDNCKQRVSQAENSLQVAKANRASAKACGNYQSTAKNYRSGTKVGNVYDYNVWVAEKSLKQAKADLAAAKKNK